MPTYKYRVRNRSGEAIEGTIEAPTAELAGNQLYQLGYLPVSITEGQETASLSLSGLWDRFQKVTLEDLIIFSQQLSTLYKAGLPLLTGLMSLGEQVENKKLKQTIGEVCRQVKEGSTLFTSMAKFPETFSSVYVNIVRAGETSGLLGESLDRFILLADRELKTRQRVKEATRYPKMVVLSLIVAFGVLIAFVIPRFAQVFAQFKTPLPLPTRIMIGINNLFQHYWYLILAACVVSFLLIRRYLRTYEGRSLWDRVKIQIPVFGNLFLKAALSRFATTLSMLYRSGIPILQALDITSQAINNIHLSQIIEGINFKIREGKSLAGAMSESGRFTPLIIQMVSVGESTGTLAEMLLRVTEYYDVEVDNAIRKMSTYIEPALTVFLAVFVLFLALAVFLPWWNMAALFR